MIAQIIDLLTLQEIVMASAEPNPMPTLVALVAFAACGDCGVLFSSDIEPAWILPNA